MVHTIETPPWFKRGLETAESLREQIGVVLVTNLKERTKPIDDYATDSIVTEFLSNRELDDFIVGFEKAGIFCEVVVDEEGFIRWLHEGRHRFGRPQPLIYNITQNGTGSARFSLVPGLCRLHGLPLIDSDAYGAALGQHKFHVISLLEHFGLPVARSWWFTNHGWWPAAPPAGLRVIAKPTLDSASMGIRRDSVCVVDAQLEQRLADLSREFRQPITVQEFIPGFEVEVPVLEAKGAETCMAVGIALHGQRNLGDDIMAYDDVFADGYSFYDFATVDREQAGYLQAVARKAYVGLGFTGPARVDFRVSLSNGIKVMEVTAKPHLTAHTSFMHMIQAMGRPYSDLLKYIVGAAAHRLKVAHSAAQN